MSVALDELTKDFKESMSEIDFKSYDPFSKQFMRVLFIGQVWMAVRMLEEDDGVDEELDGARKYWGVFTETGDSSFKEMALDELRHAGTLIKRKLAKESDPEARAVLNEKEKERGQLQKMMTTLPASSV